MQMNVPSASSQLSASDQSARIVRNPNEVTHVFTVPRHQNCSSVSDHCGQRRTNKKNSDDRRTTPLRTVPNTNLLNERTTPMNARRAKQLRRLVSMTYNADVTTTPRQYGRIPSNWTIFNTGVRRAYQLEKSLFLRTKRMRLAI